MERQRVFKNVIIGALVICVVVLSVAFATFTQALTIVGTAKLSSASDNWNVKISEVETLGVTGYATQDTGSNYSVGTDGSTSASFSCTFKAPGDTCTASGTLKNLGTINAKYAGATLAVTKAGTEQTVSGLTYNDTDITATLTPPTGWTVNTTSLAQNDSGNFTLEIKANDNATFESEVTYVVTATFNFDQADGQ